MPQNSHETKSEALMAFCGIAAPQLGQFRACIGCPIVKQNWLGNNTAKGSVENLTGGVAYNMVNGIFRFSRLQLRTR